MEEKKNNFISFTIDLNKIPEYEIVTKDKNGEPFKNNNQFVNCIAFINDEPDQYGNIVNVILKGKKGEKPIYIGGKRKLTNKKKSNDNIQILCYILYNYYYF